MKNIDEFNTIEINNGDSPKNEDSQEIKVYSNPEFEEFSGVHETSEKKVRKKSGGNSKIISVITAAVAAVTTATLISPLNSANTKAEFLELGASDTFIYYTIKLEDYLDKNYEVTVYNDFVTKKEAYDAEYIGEEGFIGGEIGDLKPGMNYNISVECENKRIAKTKIRTLRTDEMPRYTEFYSVYYENSPLDRTFKLTLYYIDENGYWSDFVARFTSYDITYDFELSAASEQEQVIVFPDDFMPSSNANLSIICRSTQDNALGLEKVLYSEQIDLYVEVPQL